MFTISEPAYVIKVLITWANTGVSAEPVHLHSPTRAFGVHTHKSHSMTKPTKWPGATREHSDQPGHLPSLIRVCPVRMKKPWVLSYPLSGQRRHWSDWADTQADLSLRWGHMSLCWFYRAEAQIYGTRWDFKDSNLWRFEWLPMYHACLRIMTATPRFLFLLI